MNVLLTGFSGNIGVQIAEQLAVRHRVLALARSPETAPRLAGVTLLKGSLESLPSAPQEIDAIIHCAAATAFRAPLDELRKTNVAGTVALLDFARGCPRLRKFIHISTTCVCGERAGHIPEAPLPEPAAFVNAYEQSKWEAEQLVLASGLPVEIARLAIVAGSERDGSVRRPGAFHHTLFWLFKGLIPMTPGAPAARVDLISTEAAAGIVTALLEQETVAGRVVHASLGSDAPVLHEALDFIASVFSQHHRGWASGAVSRPDIVDAQTFALFEASVHASGDALFRRVCEDARSFLPGLLHPRVMATSLAETVPQTDWRPLVRCVVTSLLATNWGRQPAPSQLAREQPALECGAPSRRFFHVPHGLPPPHVIGSPGVSKALRGRSALQSAARESQRRATSSRT